MSFKLTLSDQNTSARTGILATSRGEIETPVFMPIGTVGAVKTLSPEDLKTANASIILGNAYHLLIRPGLEVIQEAGGLHNFISWDKPILTDSGGFQVFSLAKLRKITDEGVVFKSSLDGTEFNMTPEKSMEIQLILGSDIMMAFDECPPGDASKKEIKKAVERTTRWMKQCAIKMKVETEKLETDQMLFPIVQGGVDYKLRKQSVEELTPFINSGVAVGGLAVGEEKSAMFDTLEKTNELLPANSARYLMGVGKPVDIVKAVLLGMDMFDCVIPTRNGRNGQFFTWHGKINIFNEKYKTDFSPVDENCACYGCSTFSRSYLRHLFKMNEILGLRMASLHNVTFYLSLMEKIRNEIKSGNFEDWSKQFLENDDGSNRCKKI